MATLRSPARGPSPTGPGHPPSATPGPGADGSGVSACQAALPRVVWQPSLFDAAAGPDAGGAAFDPAFPTARRRFLGAGAWVDHAPGAISAPGALFEAVLSCAPWSARCRPMYDRIVAEPRLTSGVWADPPAPVAAIGRALSARYGADLSAVSANLYRGGSDSVAWHGDRVGRGRAATVVALVSLGSSRPFLLRPHGGGCSVRYVPAPGDLLVMGGTCQRTWEHSVPKCSGAGPRISLMFREPL